MSQSGQGTAFAFENGSAPNTVLKWRMSLSLWREHPFGILVSIVVWGGYALTAVGYPFVICGIQTEPYFGATYWGFWGTLGGLSVVLIILKERFVRGVVLFLKTLLMVFSHLALTGFFPLQLILAVGLVVETSMLLSPPWNWLFSLCETATLTFYLANPAVLGTSRLTSATGTASVLEILVFVFVLIVVLALSSMWWDLRTKTMKLADTMSENERKLDTLSSFNQNLQEYARTIDSLAAERERQRISREVHDISGYVFTNITSLMDAAGSLLERSPDRIPNLLQTTRNQAQQGLRETRQALRNIRGSAVTARNPNKEIFQVVSVFRRVTGVQVRLSLGNLPSRLPELVCQTLYRTVQEALTNAIRHGLATRITIHFLLENQVLNLRIEDNGKGAQTVIQGIGLEGMHERLDIVHGNLSFGKSAEGGFALSLRIPIEGEPQP